jgi:hypothetical protein
MSIWFMPSISLFDNSFLGFQMYTICPPKSTDASDEIMEAARVIEWIKKNKEKLGLPQGVSFNENKVCLAGKKSNFCKRCLGRSRILECSVSREFWRRQKQVCDFEKVLQGQRKRSDPEKVNSRAEEALESDVEI